MSAGGSPEEIEALEAQIKTAGDIVRQLKKAGKEGDEEAKAQVPAAVEKLLALKKALEEAQKTTDSAEAADGGSTGQIVTPFDVEAGEDGVDYTRLMRDFGTQAISPELIERFEAVTGKPVHPWVRRGIFFSHRDLGKLLDFIEKSRAKDPDARVPVYLYTGRGPSSESMHLGHCIPFLFTKWLQDVLECQLVIQMTTDEKMLWRGISMEDARKFCHANARDVVAIAGFEPENTFIFDDLDYVGTMYPVVVRVQRSVNLSQVRSMFGINNTSNIGQCSFPAIQAAPSFSASFPHLFAGRTDLRVLIPCAIDQDVYFRMTRDVSRKLKWPLPSLIHSSFFPSLGGPRGKMSASNTKSSIFLNDSKKKIKKKINASFSGGQETLELQRELGGNPDVDVAFQLLKFFMIGDVTDRQSMADADARLEEIAQQYRAGEMLTGELKKIAIGVMQEFVAGIQARREQVSDEVLAQFFDTTPRDIGYGVLSS